MLLPTKQNRALIATARPRLAEDVQGNRDLGHHGHDVPPPQLVVLNAVRRDCMLAAEVDEEDRRPQNLQGASAPSARRLLVAVEEGGERIDGQGIGAEVGEPNALPGHRDAKVAHHGAGEEDELQEDAAQNEDPQLPLLPPPHSS